MGTKSEGGSSSIRPLFHLPQQIRNKPNTIPRFQEIYPPIHLSFCCTLQLAAYVMAATR
jgi:hypothetical protein